MCATDLRDEPVQADYRLGCVYDRGGAGEILEHKSAAAAAPPVHLFLRTQALVQAAAETTMPSCLCGEPEEARGG